MPAGARRTAQPRTAAPDQPPSTGNLPPHPDRAAPQSAHAALRTAGARSPPCRPTRYHLTAMAPPARKPLSDTVRTLGALSTVGFSFVLAIVIGVWVGWVLDRWLGTSPWMFFLFFVLGLVAGVLNVYRTAGRFLK